MKKSHPRRGLKKDGQFDLKAIRTAIDSHFYRLDGRTAVRCTLAEYARAMQDDSQRVVAQTPAASLQVSTVFTGIDQNFGKGKPALFETVVFGLPDELRPRWLHSTWEEAMEHHRNLVQSIENLGYQALLDEVRLKDGGA